EVPIGSAPAENCSVREFGLSGALSIGTSCFCYLTGLSGRRWRACALATVRRSNCTDGFPVCSFHEDSEYRDAKDGINRTRFTSPYCSYSVATGSNFHALAATPSLEPMRPDTPDDPAVKSVEEFSDVSAFEIFAPSPHQWVQLGDQLLRRQRHTALCALT